MKLSNEKLEELKLEIINYIRRKIKEIGADRIVIGLSGGKDSSVCLKLSTLALTSEKVTGLIILMEKEMVLNLQKELLNL